MNDDSPDRKPKPPTEGGETVVVNTPSESISELAAILDQYLADLEAGKTPDRARLLADHPHLATQLEQALDGLEFIHRAKTQPEPAPIQLGDFRILREVGRGGMGVVYEAEQISLRRRVALKVLRFGAVADEMAMQRFQREAETVAHLHHTNIVPIFAIGAEAGVRYYAMQFIEGHDLAELVRTGSVAAGIPPAAEPGSPPGGSAAQGQTGTVPATTPGRKVTPRDMADWGLQAAEALAHAHQRGVIHRDIKPSNLILDREGRIWLTDFGLARRVDDVALSVAGALLGTPRYMSPEQARASKDPVDHRTDIYSLGATLYELATRRPIFEAASPHEVITQILNTTPAPPSVVCPEVPRDLEIIIMKCLAKEARHRYASAQALADDLRAFLEGRAISARPPSLPERVVRWTRQNRRTVTTATVSAGVSLLVLLGGSLGWQQHRQSREGQLAVRTGGQNLVAEVLDEHDRAVMPSFPVPPLEPVSLPAGTYQVRLSASGLLSETWPVDIHRGQLEQPTIQLPARWLWPPRESSSGEMPETHVLSLDGRADVIQLTQAVLDKDGRRYEQRVQRLEGATGLPRWTHALVLTPSNVPPGMSWEEWQRVLWPASISPSGDRPRLLRSAPDLDGDGIGDLVWSSRHVSALGAVSGADGRILWWHRGRSEPPASAEDPIAKTEGLVQGTLVGEPTVADVDHDGVMDFLACYGSEGDRYRTRGNQTLRGDAQSWVSLVSGKTGRELWRQRVDARWERTATSSTDQRRNNALGRPALGQSGGRAVVLLCLGTKLQAWDARTGEPAWPAQEVGFAPWFAPEAVDVDGDGDSEVLLTRRPDHNQVAYEARTILELVAWSPKRGAALWRRAFLPVHYNSAHEIDEAIDPFHRVADLEGDGRPEVLLPVGRWYGWSTAQRWSGIEVVDAATGQPKWMTRVAVETGHVPARTVDEFTTGPDLDRDGVKEVFVSWNGFESERKRDALNVAALSGTNGAMLWKWSQPIHGPAQALDWWHAGPDGWPMLIVPTRGGPGGQRMTYFLSVSDGRLQHTLPDVAEVIPADFDGDGILDLSYTVYPQGAARHLVIRGEPPAAWQRLGCWRAGHDYDGDGFSDFVNASSDLVAVRAGRDGRELWRIREKRPQPELFLTPAGGTADLNRDGTPDFVGPVLDWEKSGPHSRTSVSRLAAYSGKDGQRLWTATTLELGNSSGSSSRAVWSYNYPRLDAADLDGDGRAEILSVQSRSDKPLQLAAVSGADGRLLWEVPIVMGGWAPRPSADRRPLADLNGDGVLDPVLWRPTGDERNQDSSCILTAWDGRDGRMLWAAPPAGIQRESQIIWPEPTVGDLDGDGSPEVIVAMHHGYDGASGYACDLIAVDGRSGAPRWTWRWTAGLPGLWPPLVITDRDGRGLVCIAVRDSRSKLRIVVLTSDGQVAQELTLGGEPSNYMLFTHGSLAWRAVDLDGDGGTELLFVNDGRLTAARGAALETVWTWELPDPITHITEVRPASAGRSAEIVAWSGHAAYGLSGGTGRALWRGEVPSTPRWGMSDPPVLLVLDRGARSGGPSVQLWWPNHSDYRWATVCRQTWPVTESGAYRAPSPEKIAFTPLPEVPAPGRPLPWTVNRNAQAWFCSGLLPLLLLGVPAFLIHLAVKRRSVLPGLVLAGYAAVSVWVFGQAVVPIIGAGFALWMLGRAAKLRSLPQAVLAVCCGALALAPAWWRASEHFLRETHAWGAWWWVDEWLGERILLALVAIPGLAFWVHTVWAIRRRQWNQVRWLAAASMVSAAVAAGIWIWSDRSRLQAQESYSWSGWYWVWLAGTYITGVVSVILLARVAWIRRRGRRNTAPDLRQARPA